VKTPVTYFNHNSFSLFIILVLLSSVLSFHFEAGAVLINLFILTVFLIYRLTKLPQTFMAFLSLVLASYMIGGRGFAYLGFYPIFVGEIALFFGLFTATVVIFNTNSLSITKMPLKIFQLIFILLGAAYLIDDIPKYGMLAFRDAVIWGYAFFAVFLFVTIYQNKKILLSIPHRFGSSLPIIVVAIPVVFLIFRLDMDLIPRWPFG
jgi:hypothetical protein